MSTPHPARANLRSKSKYVVPNSITALSMILGLISIYFSFNRQFEVAGWVILYSTILDKLDGSTARVLNASSEFGVQMDSFSDLIAFGIAPAFLVFSICVGDPDVSAHFLSKDTPFFLYFSLIFFVLAAMLRLARFNVTTFPDSKYMIGLATTASGGLIASYVLMSYAYKDVAFFLNLLRWLPYFTLLLGGLMISNLPMAKIGSRKTVVTRAVEFAILIVTLLCILTRSLPELLFVLGAGYSIQGFVLGFFNREAIFAELRGAVETEASEAATATTVPANVTPANESADTPCEDDAAGEGDKA